LPRRAKAPPLPAEWDERLRPLLVAFGEDVVRAACLDLFRFPAELVLNQSEVRSIRQSIERINQ
jgi:hypothetical protein